MIAVRWAVRIALCQTGWPESRTDFRPAARGNGIGRDLRKLAQFDTDQGLNRFGNSHTKSVQIVLLCRGTYRRISVETILCRTLKKVSFQFFGEWRAFAWLLAGDSSFECDRSGCFHRAGMRSKRAASAIAATAGRGGRSAEGR